MSIFNRLAEIIKAELAKIVAQGGLPEALLAVHFVVEPPRDTQHGDAATNIAMVGAKAAALPPRALAEKIVPFLQAHAAFTEVSVAGPGFINLRVSHSLWHQELQHILRQGVHYGDSAMGAGKAVNIEYVSANPTGPMHIGHVRGAVIGDVLANLLRKTGYKACKEYYFNDAGTQVDVLARSTHLRYREALGETIGEIPEGFYPGEYLCEVAQALVARDGAKWQNKTEEQWLVPLRSFAVEFLMGVIRQDLALIGISHEVFTNERELIENGTLDTAFQILQDKGLIYTGTLPPPKGKVVEDYEPVPLTLFRSSAFGDSSDRPLKKRDGTYAYIMPDIAYHYDKIRRGFHWMINVLGSDHGGYLERLRPAVAAFSQQQARLDVLFNQMVKVLKNGEPVKLSKRSGNLITLRETVEEVGADAVRFFMLTRSADAHLEFDFSKAVEQSRDNPVFYVQYAHARCCSVVRHATEIFGADALGAEALATVSLAPLNSADDIQLVQHLSTWPRVVEAAATALEPHRIAYFLYDCAAAFHGFWHKGREDAQLRFIIEDNRELTLARLALLRGVMTVLASGLAVMGIRPAEELRG